MPYWRPSQQYPGKVSFTADMWSSKSSSYLYVMAHWPAFSSGDPPLQGQDDVPIMKSALVAAYPMLLSHVQLPLEVMTLNVLNGLGIGFHKVSDALELCSLSLIICIKTTQIEYLTTDSGTYSPFGVALANCIVQDELVRIYFSFSSFIFRPTGSSTYRIFVFLMNLVFEASCEKFSGFGMQKSLPEPRCVRLSSDSSHWYGWRSWYVFYLVTGCLGLSLV